MARRLSPEGRAPGGGNPFFSLARPLYLASGSPRRRRLLEELGVPFRVIEPATAEKGDPGWGPAEEVVEHAKAKARAAAALVHGAGIVLAADTLVLAGGVTLGKPRDRDEALAMLARITGRTHEVLTGIALLELPEGHMRTGCARTRVHMRAAEESELAAYVATGEPMDKAGSYGIQGFASALVDRVEGCPFNVVGLPISLVASMLQDLEAAAGSSGTGRTGGVS